MKNVKITHEFTLEEILEGIVEIGREASTWAEAGESMTKRLKDYLEMIE